ncbi:MAG: NADH-quinone oxidoreductase subunit L [Anaerolineales bacterium]|nr:NADH-quinone oxidoreductase subunit L [Anaerolineales bacterium]
MLLREAAATNYFNLVPWVVFFPVLGILINLLVGGRLREKMIGVIASLAVAASFAVAVLLALSLNDQHAGTIIAFMNLEWISIGDLHIDWAFRVDTLSVTMMLAVSGVGTLIHIYAIAYMHADVRHHQDPTRYRRFFVFFNLFIVMMMILVSADNYLMLFVGWEGVGLCSYLLIGFWYDKGKGGANHLDGISNALAGKKAFITNRIGDFGFLIATFLMFGAFGSLQFDTVFTKAPFASQGTILAITLFMLLGVAGKSAQLPLYVWLPDAMAGPTPVSALIHAATMVTAGVYLVARSHELYALSSQAQNIVALVGGLTALFAATIAVGQFDIKKLLAYSTISQLGFMVAAVGMGAIVAGIFHLVTHAFFKALLFLSAGSVIQGVEAGHHAMEHGSIKESKHKRGEHLNEGGEFDAQDMRNMGGLSRRMPVTFVVYLVGALALAGIFPLAGFWSKDEILAEALHLHPAVFVLLIIAAFFTAFYMTRQIWMIFFSKPRSRPAEYARENSLLLTLPLILLAVLSVFGGALNLPFWHTLTHWLDYTLAEGAKVGSFNYLVAGLSTVLALAAIALGIFLYGKRYQAQAKLPAAQRPVDPVQPYLRGAFTGIQHKWWIDEFYDWLILRRYVALSRFLSYRFEERFWHDWLHDNAIAGSFRQTAHFLAQPVDLGIIDGIANGLGTISQRFASWIRRAQNGFVRSYATWVLAGMVIILGYLILR